MLALIVMEMSKVNCEKGYSTLKPEIMAWHNQQLLNAAE